MSKADGMNETNPAGSDPLDQGSWRELPSTPLIQQLRWEREERRSFDRIVSWLRKQEVIQTTRSDEALWLQYLDIDPEALAKERALLADYEAWLRVNPPLTHQRVTAILKRAGLRRGEHFYGSGTSGYDVQNGLSGWVRVSLELSERDQSRPEGKDGTLCRKLRKTAAEALREAGLVVVESESGHLQVRYPARSSEVQETP